MDHNEKIRFGIVGAGRRAHSFIRTAAALPDMFCVTGVVARNAEKRLEIASGWNISAYESVADLIGASPVDFVVLCLPSTENAAFIQYLAEHNVAVLVETPPANRIDGLIDLYRLTEQGAKVQVAEQYHLRPMHAARLQLCREGLIGAAHYAQLSAGHGYHGISLMRRLLGIGCDNAEIVGVRHISDIAGGPDRYGLPKDGAFKKSTQDIAIFNFGDKVGIIDFSADQYFSWIRSTRVTVYGENGEIQNDEVAYMADYSTPIRVNMKRIGENGNTRSDCLLGICAGDRWLYRNPFISGRLNDDEIAITSCLQGMRQYIRTGEHMYSIAEAAQDQYLSLMMNDALKSGQKVHTTTQPWANAFQKK